MACEHEVVDWKIFFQFIIFVVMQLTIDDGFSRNRRRRADSQQEIRKCRSSPLELCLGMSNSVKRITQAILSSFHKQMFWTAMFSKQWLRFPEWSISYSLFYLAFHILWLEYIFSDFCTYLHWLVCQRASSTDPLKKTQPSVTLPTLKLVKNY